jgi:hypothetical protein
MKSARVVGAMDLVDCVSARVALPRGAWTSFVAGRGGAVACGGLSPETLSPEAER